MAASPRVNARIRSDDRVLFCGFRRIEIAITCVSKGVLGRLVREWSVCGLKEKLMCAMEYSDIIGKSRVQSKTVDYDVRVEVSFCFFNALRVLSHIELFSFPTKRTLQMRD